MKDTDSKTQKLILKLMKEKSGEERLRMGFSMYDTARALVEASIHAQFPNLSPADYKRIFFLRFYGSDFTQKRKEEILQAL